MSEFSVSEISNLCRKLHGALQSEERRSVAFASCHSAKTGSALAAATALHYATFFNTPALLLHVRPGTQTTPMQALVHMQDAVQSLQPVKGLFAEALLLPALQGTESLNVSQLETIFDQLHEQFGFILVHAADILHDPWALHATSMCRKTVIMAEANHSRAPVLLEMKRLLDEQGNAVVGSVFTGRTHDIPASLYRFLYQRRPRKT